MVMIDGKPVLLDTFCSAGGCSRGYQQAGFYVLGIDINPQKNYIGDDFLQMDALEALRILIGGGYLTGRTARRYWLADFAVIHASPPCQAYSVMTLGRWQDREHPELIPIVRALLVETGKPFVIENVSGARGELINPILLCGTMFGLQTDSGSQLRRHRYFECSELFALTPTCQHNNGSAIGVYGGGQNPARKRPATIGVWGHSGGSSNRDGVIQFGVDDRKTAMGIDWMSRDELSQAIPPKYTEWIGQRLMEVLQVTM